MQRRAGSAQACKRLGATAVPVLRSKRVRRSQQAPNSAASPLGLPARNGGGSWGPSHPASSFASTALELCVPASCQASITRWRLPPAAQDMSSPAGCPKAAKLLPKEPLAANWSLPPKAKPTAHIPERPPSSPQPIPAPDTHPHLNNSKRHAWLLCSTGAACSSTGGRGRNWKSSSTWRRRWPPAKSNTWVLSTLQHNMSTL